MKPSAQSRADLIARLKAEARARMDAERAARAAAAARHAVAPAALLLLPATHLRGTEPVGPARIAAVAAHIAHLLAEQADPTPEPEAESHPLAATACTLCAGACCTKLGRQEHFYMRPDTLARIGARIGAAHPGTHPGTDLPALYASLVPAEAVENSCVFNIPTGCALPTDLRSDVCNTFWCTPMRQMIRTGEAIAVIVALQVDGVERVRKV